MQRADMTCTYNKILFSTDVDKHVGSYIDVMHKRIPSIYQQI